jgi:hypothetical protein
MPSKAAAVFCTDKKDLESIVKNILDGTTSNVTEGLKWFEIVAGKEPTKASKHIWEAIALVLK